MHVIDSSSIFRTSWMKNTQYFSIAVLCLAGFLMLCHWADSCFGCPYALHGGKLWERQMVTTIVNAYNLNSCEMPGWISLPFMAEVWQTRQQGPLTVLNSYWRSCTDYFLACTRHMKVLYLLRTDEVADRLIGVSMLSRARGLSLISVLSIVLCSLHICEK